MKQPIKKAILTGGGRATRLFPVTANMNKHLIPLANKPMIHHAIELVVQSGIEEIFINTNPGDTSLPDALGDGRQWGITISYFEQTGGPQGIAHVVNEAKEFIGDDPFMLYLSDNILLGGVKELVEEFNASEHDCMLALSKVKDPQRFGIPYFDENGKLTTVVEKPENPPNDLAVTGIYLYAGDRLFFDTFDKIEKSDRGEYEISSIHALLLEEGKSVGYKEITGWWKDTGKAGDLLLANTLLLDAMEQSDFEKHGELVDGDGHICIGKDTTIGEDVILVGPVIVGDNCVLERCTVGPHVTLGNECRIVDATVESTIVLDKGSLEHVNLHESLISKGVSITKAADKQRVVVGERTILEL